MTGEAQHHDVETPVIGTADLIGYGRIGWSDFARMLATAQTAYADYDGFHIGPAPSESPPYSHLWAWSDRWLIRARVDGDHAIAGALVLTAAPDNFPPPRSAETVQYERSAAVTWGPKERRVGPLSRRITNRPVNIYLISGERPVTFIAADPAT